MSRYVIFEDLGDQMMLRPGPREADRNLINLPAKRITVGMSCDFMQMAPGAGNLKSFLASNHSPKQTWSYSHLNAEAVH